MTGGEGGIQLARFASSLPTCRCAAAGQNSDGFIYDIRKVPTVADGGVAYRQADYVIDLLSADDPTDLGIDVQDGDQLKVDVDHVRNGTTIMSGTGRVRIIPQARPSINLSTPGQNQLLKSADPGPILPWTLLRLGNTLAAQTDPRAGHEWQIHFVHTADSAAAVSRHSVAEIRGL